jgi:hypothetical protein
MDNRRRGGDGCCHVDAKATAGTNTPEEKADFIADVNALLKLVSAAAGHKLCRELHLTDI